MRIISSKTTLVKPITLFSWTPFSFVSHFRKEYHQNFHFFPPFQLLYLSCWLWKRFSYRLLPLETCSGKLGKYTSVFSHNCWSRNYDTQEIKQESCSALSASSFVRRSESGDSYLETKGKKEKLFRSRPYHWKTSLIAPHVRFYHSFSHFPPSVFPLNMIKQSDYPQEKTDASALKENEEDGSTTLQSSFSEIREGTPSDSNEKSRRDLEEDDVVLSDYSSCYIQFLSHQSDLMDRPTVDPNGVVLGAFSSTCGSQRNCRVGIGDDSENDGQARMESMRRRPCVDTQGMNGGSENVLCLGAKGKVKSEYRTNIKGKKEEEEGQSRNNVVKMSALNSSTMCGAPLSLTCESVEESGEGSMEVDRMGACAATPLSSFFPLSSPLRSPLRHGSTPLRKMMPHRSPVPASGTALLEMEASTTPQVDGDSTVAVRTGTTISDPFPSRTNSIRSSLTPSALDGCTTLPSSATEDCGSDLASSIPPGSDEGGLSEDVVDIVTDAFKAQREKAVAERQRFLYALTHPIVTDYTYKGKLVPPPPFHFGRITQEAKDLAQKMLVQPCYSLVLQAGTRHDPSVGSTSTPYGLSSSFSASSRCSYVGASSPSSSVEVGTGKGKGGVGEASFNYSHRFLGSASSPRQGRTRAHRDPSNIFAYHNYFFEINDLYQEVVLVGRASAGKSTLLNAILNQPSMAKTSSTPHTTRKISFYQSCTKDEMKRFYATERHQLVKLPGKGLQLTFVDIPGFGIEGMSDRWRDETIVLTDSYFGTRRSINTVLFCLDVDKGLTKVDIKYFNWLENVHGIFFIVLTKCDSVPHSRICAVMHQVYALITKHRKKFRKVFPFILPTSALTGENIDELRGMIMETSGMMSGQRLREVLKRKQKAWEAEALREEEIRFQEAQELNQRHALEFCQLRVKSGTKFLLDGEGKQKKQTAQTTAIKPSIPSPVTRSTGNVSSAPLFTMGDPHLSDLTAEPVEIETDAQVTPTEKTALFESEDTMRKHFSSKQEKNGDEIKEGFMGTKLNNSSPFPSPLSSSSSSSPLSYASGSQPPLAVSRKTFLKWRDNHPHPSHTLKYEGHRVRLHSGLNSPHIVSISNTMINTVSEDMKRKTKKTEEEVQEEETAEKNEQKKLLLSNSLSSSRMGPAYQNHNTNSAITSAAKGMCSLDGRSLVHSLSPLLGSISPSFVRDDDRNQEDHHRDSLFSSSLSQAPKENTAIHSSLPCQSSTGINDSSGGGGRRGAVSAFLDDFQQFQQVPHSSQTVRIKYKRHRDNLQEGESHNRKGMVPRDQGREVKVGSIQQGSIVKIYNASPLEGKGHMLKDDKEIGPPIANDDCRRKNSPDSCLVPSLSSSSMASSSHSARQASALVYRAPFFAEDETGRLASFTAGRRSGPSVLSLNSSVHHRKAEYKGKVLGQLLQKENPEAPWRAVDSLRRKIDEAKEQLLIPTFSSSSAVKVEHQRWGTEKGSGVSSSRMNRKDREAYLRYAGRLTSSFEQFTAEVACTKYMTEIRQAKTLRSKEQMHFNATGKINYRSMPKGLWKEYGSSNHNAKNNSIHSRQARQPKEDVRDQDIARTHTSSSETDEDCGTLFRASSSFPTFRVLGCESTN